MTRILPLAIRETIDFSSRQMIRCGDSRRNQPKEQGMTGLIKHDLSCHWAYLIKSVARKELDVRYSLQKQQKSSDLPTFLQNLLSKETKSSWETYLLLYYMCFQAFCFLLAFLWARINTGRRCSDKCYGTFWPHVVHFYYLTLLDGGMHYWWPFNY